ncbi:VTT domain-containing protein [Streptomyces sp. NBC_01283]|uniref:DedA family protein n=1 Tax=Streptomyces sp. NBC_01283 TaxID=2903812 RepID=UPI00352C7E78|nr:VTT domain-containing protein [Streptomyces sp. NBC_01283]
MSEPLGRLAVLLQAGLDSPLLWLIVFLVAALDALLPLMPSETTVVMVAVLIGPELPRLALLAAVATAGALCGDCLGHGVGRWLGPRAVARLMRGERGRRRYEWGRGMVERHAVALVVAGRFLPGGRVVAGLSTGSLGFPFRRFVALDAAGAGLWAVSSTAVGLVGGASFGDEPVKGLGLAFVLALVVVAGVESVRRLRVRQVTPGGRCPSEL